MESGETDTPEVQIASFRAIVRGRVQGIGFRYFVRSRAEELELCGTVRNLTNGIVEVEAAGHRPQLDRLIEHLHEGPGLASVQSVEVDWEITVTAGGGFRITY